MNQSIAWIPTQPTPMIPVKTAIYQDPNISIPDRPNQAYGLLGIQNSPISPYAWALAGGLILFSAVILYKSR